MPPRLYKFQRFSDRSLDNLRNRKLWFSKPIDFNDPFDCAIRIDRDGISDEELRDLYNRYRQDPRFPDGLFDAKYVVNGKPNDIFRTEMERGIEGAIADTIHRNTVLRGVCCFCESCDCTLMWSHYADSHKGFCLEFDTAFDPFSKARSITYTDDFPVFSVVDMLFSPDKVDSLSMLFTKAECWKYERERRIHSYADTTHQYPQESLKAVYLGACMLDENKTKIRAVLRGTTTEVYELVREKRSFRFQRSRIGA